MEDFCFDLSPSSVFPGWPGGAFFILTVSVTIIVFYYPFTWRFPFCFLLLDAFHALGVSSFQITYIVVLV